MRLSVQEAAFDLGAESNAFAAGAAGAGSSTGSSSRTAASAMLRCTVSSKRWL